ncbi:MAG: tetratricopeptide repeat protein [Scytolyngbya sp. HA4215-MV1]|jgi:curved DNA-binding protein CbpA|nr:tetratricopeptide repeat protein [Scytolyngbya sp. HA4215-MV1]
MVSQIERGLFALDFSDHHAVLGVSVDADMKEIRKRYLVIARRLHPDSCVTEGEDEKQRASQYLSKLVNPAWEKLSNERERTEYALLLKLKGQQAQRQQSSLQISGSLAQQLLLVNNPDYFYKTSLKELADKQYDNLDQILEITAQISELNLVYLLRKEGQADTTQSEPKRAIYTTSSGNTSGASGTTPTSSSGDVQPTAATPTPARPDSLADQYYRRAETFASRGNFAQAILELRDALQMEPNNSRCHSLMGMVYLRQKQTTMAKIHFNQALKLDPKDPMALQGKRLLESSGGKGTTQPAANKSDKPPNKPGGGGLFGMFGGKKK